MSAFDRSIRVLRGQWTAWRTTGVVAGLLLASAWMGWFLFARVGVYVVTRNARLEVRDVVHPVQVTIGGRIARSHLSLGREVKAGDVLLELDDSKIRLELAEARARVDASTAQLVFMREEVASLERLLREQKESGRLAVGEAAANYRAAAAAASLATEEARRFRDALRERTVSEVEALRASADGKRQRSAARAHRLQVQRAVVERQARASQSEADLKRLQRESAVLEGQINSGKASIARLEYDLDVHKVRAPLTGRVGQVAVLPTGKVVDAGEQVAAIVPDSPLRIVADFDPGPAMGRVQPGQPAIMRLEGYPWTQYGSLVARTTSVASEPSSGRIRVELAIDWARSAALPRQHGLPGEVAVEIERISPAMLVLRAAGRVGE